MNFGFNNSSLGFDNGTGSVGPILPSIETLTGIAPDIAFLGGLTSTIAGETLTPSGATTGNPLDRATTNINSVVLESQYRFSAVNDSLVASSPAAIQPGSGNILWSFLLRLDPGTTRVGDIASNSDGTTGWRLAWNSASELIIFTGPGPVVAAVASSGEQGLLSGIWHMCSFLANRDTGRLYVVDDWTTRDMAESSSVVLPASDWDNPGTFAIGNGTAASFAGWDCVAAIRWTGLQLAPYDGAQLVQHHELLRPDTIARFAEQLVGEGAALERVTDEIAAPTPSYSIFANGNLSFAATAGVPIVPDMWAQGFVDDAKYLEPASEHITLTSGNILVIPPSAQGRFLSLVNIVLTSSGANHSVELLLELGVSFTTTPGDGTILFSFLLPSEAGASASTFVFILSSLGRLVTGGPDLNVRFTFTSSSTETLTYTTRVANWTRQSI